MNAKPKDINLETDVGLMKTQIAVVVSKVDSLENRHCKKEDKILALESAVKDIPEMGKQIETWKSFRNAFVGAIGSLVVFSVSAIFAYADAKVKYEFLEERVKVLESERERDIQVIKKKLEELLEIRRIANK